MRDNGLTAASYRPAGEVDPPATDAVLRSLAEAGIAAYTEPSADGDRLYVDASESERAGAVVRRTTHDVVFDTLVARFEAVDPPGERPWPDAENVESAGAGRTRFGSGDRTFAPRPRREPDQDHFVPPEPEPGPRLDWISRLAWTGLLGGPVVLVLAAMLGVGDGGRFLAVALLAFVAGFVTLVLRMQERTGAGEPPDDGAVV